MMPVRANGSGHQVAPLRMIVLDPPAVDLDDDGPAGRMSGLEKGKVYLGGV